MYTINSQLVKRDCLLPGIHGLRGLAAFGIVLFHLVHIGGVVVPDYLTVIKRDFGYFVHLFFLLSAFSLMQSTSRTTGSVYWVQSYFIKRFFRIAPLFYTLICFELARQAYSGPVKSSVTDIFLNFTFAFGAVPFSGLVWGGWSVGVEMIFYALFPVLVLLGQSMRAALFLMMTGIFISYLTRLALHQQHLASNPLPKWDWSYFAFMPNLAFFCMGIFAFCWAKKIKDEVPREHSNNQLKIIVTLTLALLIALGLFGLGKYFPDGGGAVILAWGFAFVGMAVWQSVEPSGWAANRLFEHLGERSFSIYLIHPIVITFWKVLLPSSHQWATNLPGVLSFIMSAAIVMLGVLVISELTYRFIEVPGIVVSRRLVRRLST